MIDDVGRAEDVFQQVMTEVWARRSQYDPSRASLLTWMMTITKSRAIDELRRARRTPSEVGLDGLAGFVSGDAEDLVERWRIADLLDRLPTDERDVLRMRFYATLTQVEIAERTATPLGTVKSQMIRGLTRLRTMLEADAEPSDTVAGRDDRRSVFGENAWTEWPFDPAAVAAGALDDDEHAAVAAALREDPAFAAEVASYQRLVAQLESLPGVVWDPIPPPPIDVGTITGSRSQAGVPAGRRYRHLLLAAAAVVVLVVAAVAVRSLGERDDTTTTRTVQLAPLADEPAGIDARVTLPTGGGDEVRVRVTGGTPTPDGFVEELWLMNSATDLISLGTFRVSADGTADATFATAADLASFDYVDGVTRAERRQPRALRVVDPALRSTALTGGTSARPASVVQLADRGHRPRRPGGTNHEAQADRRAARRGRHHLDGRRQRFRGAGHVRELDDDRTGPAQRRILGRRQRVRTVAGSTNDIATQAVLLFPDLVSAASDPNSSLTVFLPNDLAFRTLVHDLTGTWTTDRAGHVRCSRRSRPSTPSRRSSPTTSSGRSSARSRSCAPTAM